MTENLLDNISKFIKQFKIIEKNDSVLLGISGGPDSIFMLHVLNKIKKEMDFRISVATFNHKLRKEAGKESDFVKKVCNKMNVNFFYGEEDVEQTAHKEKISIEEAARKERFKFLFKIKEDYKFNKIALAHNKNDFIETVLIHLIKGSGIRGLTGIKPISFNGIIHPILNIERKEIENYLLENNIPFRIDLTNYSMDYLRNKIRHQIMPLFTSINENFKEKIFNMGIVLSDEDSFLSQISKKDAEIISKNDKFSLKLFLSLPIFEQRRIIKNLLNNRASFQRIEHIISFLKGDKYRISLLEDLFLVKKNGFFYVEKNKNIPFSINETYTINIPGETEINKIGCRINTEISKKFNKAKFEPLSAVFDFNKIPLPLSLRFRRRGDRIIIENGSKKIQDLFVNAKIPVEKRPYVPFLIDAKKNIIWIIGVRRSALYKLDKTTKTALLVRTNFTKKQFML